MKAMVSRVLEFGDFRLDLEEHRLFRPDGTAVPLTPRVFETLRYLVEHPGRVAAKQSLMDAVWPDCIVEENNLAQNISTLRRIFGDSPGSQRYIATVPGRGYRFVAEVKTANGAADVVAGDVEPGSLQHASVSARPGSTVPVTIRTVIIALLVLLLGAGAYFWWRSSIPSPAPSVPEKSIAVLPFTNLSQEPENAWFVDGVQDEILTALAKVADLKVISRTSVQPYGDKGKRNRREIGEDLQVAHLLEGSVQRSGNRVRVHAQLIDARSDAHIWAERYDRDLTDVFAIQSEIAQAIVTQLQAKLSPAEKSAIAERGTQDVIAYDLYLRAKSLFDLGWNGGPKGHESLLEAASLSEQAIARDPEFFLAYRQLARTHGSLYFMGMDRTPARLASAEAAIAAAARLRPDSGEVHLLQAENFYHVLDYDRARAELARAQRTLPNEARAFLLLAQLDRRQGRWEEAVRSYERAMELDPRDSFYISHVAYIYQFQRRFALAAAVRDRSISLFPNEKELRLDRAAIDLDWRGDPRPLREAIEAFLAPNPAAVAAWWGEVWLDLGLSARDPVAIERALAAIRPDGDGALGGRFPRAWFEGLAARARGDTAAAQAAFAVAREKAEAAVRKQPDHARSWAVLGMIDAALGRKGEAIQEGRRACELFPLAKEPFGGAGNVQFLAIIYAWTGEKDLAFEQLALIAKIPSNLDYGDLRLHPFWDPLRDDPRFEKIVAELAPLN